MRITESQLRKVIRSVIKETKLDAYLYDGDKRLGPMLPHDLAAMDRRIAARGPDPFSGGITFDGSQFEYGGAPYTNFVGLDELGLDPDDACAAIRSHCKDKKFSDAVCTEMCERYVWDFVN